MLIQVTGGAASGKSEFAEMLAQRLFNELQSQGHFNESLSQGCFNESPSQELLSEFRHQRDLDEIQAITLYGEAQEDRALIYLATMKNMGREAEERVKKHRKMRRGKGFTTVELWGKGDLWQQAELWGKGDLWQQAEPWGETGIWQQAEPWGEIKPRQKPDRIPEGSVVLLEDLSNLLSNLMFSAECESGNEFVSDGSGIIREERFTKSAGKAPEEGFGKGPEERFTNSPGKAPEEGFGENTGNVFSEPSKDNPVESGRHLLQALEKRASYLVIVTNEVFSDGVNYGRETMDFLKALGSLNQWIAAEARLVFEVVAGIPLLKKSTATFPADNR